METFAALRGLCVGNSSAPINSPHVNNREAGDSKRHRAHYNVILLACAYFVGYTVSGGDMELLMIFLVCLAQVNSVTKGSDSSLPSSWRACMVLADNGKPTNKDALIKHTIFVWGIPIITDFVAKRDRT